MLALGKVLQILDNGTVIESLARNK